MLAFPKSNTDSTVLGHNIASLSLEPSVPVAAAVGKACLDGWACDNGNMNTAVVASGSPQRESYKGIEEDVIAAGRMMPEGQ